MSTELATETPAADPRTALTSISATLAKTIAPLPGDDGIAGKTFLVVLCGILHRVDVYKQVRRSQLSLFHLYRLHNRLRSLFC